MRTDWVSICKVAIAACAISLSSSFVGGQTTTTTTQFVPVRTEGTIQKEATNSTNAESPTSPASTPPATNLAAAIRSVKLERTPEALFEAVQAQKAGGKLSDAERFRLAVLLSDWAQVGATLKLLPAPDAMAEYSRLLQTLASSSVSADQLFQQVRQSPSSSSSSSSNQEKRGLILSEDFYALIEAAPSDLKEQHLKPIATLLRTAIGSGGKQEFLARLEKGLKGFGGTSASGKKLAAQLLSEVGWMSDSGPYLPRERREWNDADTLMLVLTMEYFTQTGVEQKDERQLKRAAEVCAFMMQTSRFSANEGGIFRHATDRFVKLLPALDANDAEQLIRENFLTQPVIMVDLILALGDTGQRAAKGSDLKVREQSLATQSILLQVLQGKKSALPEAVNVLVMNWLTEAEQTYRYGGAGAPQNEFESDGMVVYRSYSSSQNRPQVKTLSPAVILSYSPSAPVKRRLNSGLAQRVNLTLLKVNLLDPKEPDTLETLRGYLKEHPGQEKELCTDYLNAWVRKRTVVPEDPNITRMRMMGYSVPKPQTTGIPLTRLRQSQNIQDLKALLAELRQLTREPIDPRVIVQSFMSIHSGAEVYRTADIEAIFGAPEKMDRAELMNLIGGMRAKLLQQWRDLKTQQDAGSNRTEDETKDEVSRGYRTAIELLKRGLKPENAEWKEFIVRGQLFFDTSEYEFARQVKLTDYVNLRDEAFASYRKASELYAAKIPEMPRGQWTPEPYQMWFFVMLGASDLSQLTRAAARSDPGLKQIGDAMRALPGEAAEGHLTQFGEMLGKILPQVPPNMKQRVLSAGLHVVGEGHSSAKTATDALRSYQELLDEVQLRVALDGSAEVGFQQPFGVFISLEHSRQLARESGGFTKYLQSPNNQQRIYYAPSANQPRNPRDDFTKNIHGALDETFEVVSITFHDANVKPIELEKEGWQETPFAYLVLRAKDAAVDRIPSIQLDMDFSDQAGQVVLPVRSQVQSVNARSTEPVARPSEDLTLSFVLDQREWREGKVVVEVSGRGRGIIPSHGQLFEIERPGFEVEVTDNGLSVTQFESDGRRKLAQADRNWQFTYKRKKDLRGDVTFQFPAIKPGIQTTNVDYKHYDDADLVSLEPKAALAGITLHSRAGSWTRNAALIAVLVLAGAGAWFWTRRQRVAVDAGSNTFSLPSQITPFSVAAFLRRIEREHAPKLDDSLKSTLRADIRELEANYFSGNSNGKANGNGSTDLEAVAHRWHRKVSLLVAAGLAAWFLAGLSSSARAAALGDAAPALEIAEWVKGDRVDLAEAKGKNVVVVEFWATWCGPCRVSIPHLTEMQRKFRERGVLFVGVSDEDSATVRPFVDQMGDKMDYSVAVDRSRKTFEAYMTAFGQNGIPHSFVVDREGRIAWHGHPMSGLDRVLDMLAANSFDLQSEKKRQDAQRKLREYFESALRGESDEKLDALAAELTALDKELGGINPGEKMDLQGMRKSARFQTFMRDYQRALLSGQTEAELEKIEQKAAPMAPPGFKFADFKAYYQVQRSYQEYYRVVTGRGNEATVPELTKKMEYIPPINAEMLNEMAWTLLTDERIKKRDVKLALRIARAAHDASKGQDSDVMDTYARALFDNAQVSEAIEHQQRAINLCNDRERMAELEANLKRYQSAKR